MVDGCPQAYEQEVQELEQHYGPRSFMEKYRAFLLQDFKDEFDSLPADANPLDPGELLASQPCDTRLPFFRQLGASLGPRER